MDRDINSEYVMLLFHSNNAYANAPPYYVIRTFPVFLLSPYLPPSRSEEESRRILRLNWVVVEKGVRMLHNEGLGNLYCLH